MSSRAVPLREVLDVRAGATPHWVGDGFFVRTMFSYDTDAVAASPFLLLDHGAPREFPPTSGRRGVGTHPHRGFETVTLAFQGEVEHRDSAGHQGRIGPGDVQWMTAASGVLHEEFHGRELSRRGGILEMAQVWVNLPARMKVLPPRYQDIRDGDIPVAELPDESGRVRVIAGTCLGVKGPAVTATLVEVWDVRVAARGRAALSMPEGHTVILLARRGAVTVNDATPLAEGSIAFLERHAEAFRLSSEAGADVLVLGGQPIDEPVVGRGPFVMNSHAEIVQAMRDFEAGRFGQMP